MRSILLALAVGTLPAVASAQSIQIVHRFDVPPHHPHGGLVEAADGDLYGTTSMGGDGRGTLYRLPVGPGGVIEVVHRFSRGTFPDAELARGQDGFLYGTTRYGGDTHGGTVFRFDPATRALTTLHAFTLSEGRGPEGAVLQASDGLLYGAAWSVEGSRVFQLDPVTGRVRWFRAFTFEEGTVSGTRGLIEAPNGALYGVLGYGSIGRSGSVYRLDPATGAVTIIHPFLTDEFDSRPIALSRTRDGLLYGVRAAGASGAGHIFRVDPATDTVTDVYALNPASDGVAPASPLVEAPDGSLYGTTGGPDDGTLFRLERLAGGGHAFTIVRELGAAWTGTDPRPRLALASDGWFYGAMAAGGELGGTAPGGGALVRFDSLRRGAIADPWQFQVLSVFSTRGDGWRAVGPPVTGSDGALYGVTAAGGENGRGTVYRLDPATWSFGRLGSLPADESNTGSHSGLVDGGDGSLYAVAGSSFFGMPPWIVKVTPATSTVAAIYTFFGQPELRRVHPVLVHGPGGLFGLLENGSGLQVYRFDPVALTTTIVAPPLSPGAAFGAATRLFAATDGALYASDAAIYPGRPPTFVGRVYRIDPGAHTTRLLASTMDGFMPPALARAPDGRVLIGGRFDGTGVRVRSVDPISGVAQPLCAPPAYAIADIDVAQDGSLLVTAQTAAGPAVYRCSGTTPDFARVAAWPADVGGVSIGLAADGLFYGASFSATTFDGSGTVFRLVDDGPPGTTPIIDRDGDHLSDDWERTYGLDATAGAGSEGADGDPDGDGLRNVTEQAFGQHPRGFFVRYFAEGSANAFFATQLALANPGLDPAHVLVRFQTDDGRFIHHPLLLPAMSRHTIDVGQLDGLATATFSVIVESDLPLTVDRTMTWGATAYGSHAESGVAAPSTTWYFAEGSTSGDFALFYLLLNPQPVAVLATVRFLRPSGLPPIERQYVLQPGSRTTLVVDGVDPALASTDVSAVITAPAPIIAERAMYLSRPGQPFAAGHASAGVTAPALTWVIAEGATGAFFDLFLLLANPGAQPAAVSVDYLGPGGDVLTKAYTVPANGRRTIWVDDEQLPAGSGSKPLANAAVSMIVRSTNGVPLIVERTMWWPGPEITPEFWYETHNSPGTTTTARRWALAAGDVGGPDGRETYVLIANTSATAGRVLVRLLFENGNTTGRYYDLPAASRTNVPISVDFPEAVPEGRVAVVVEDVSSAPLALAVEYASYASPDGVVWARGSSALATPLP